MSCWVELRWEGRWWFLRGTSNCTFVITQTNYLEFQKGHCSLCRLELLFCTLTAFSRHSWLQMRFSQQSSLPASASCSRQERGNPFDNIRSLSFWWLPLWVIQCSKSTYHTLITTLDIWDGCMIQLSTILSLSCVGCWCLAAICDLFWKVYKSFMKNLEGGRSYFSVCQLCLS